MSPIAAKRRVRAVLAVALLASAIGAASAAIAEDENVPEEEPVAAAPVRPERIVAAADAFLATLDDAQRKAVLFKYDDAAQRHNWSNMPDSVVTRAGLRWGDLTVRQRVALAVMLSTILSPQGVRAVRDQMDADDVYAAQAQGKPGAPHYGSGNYYVALLGTPSPAKPWMLQFGGHDLAINATLVGAHITLSPSLTGGGPLPDSTDGRALHGAEPVVAAAAALFDSLAPEQRRFAVIGTDPIDLQRGPGQDAQPPLGSRGISAKLLTDDQKDLLRVLIVARLSLLDGDALAPALTRIDGDIDHTYFAWAGPETPAGSASFRVTGPNVLIEYAPQTGGEPARILYRDPANDYGAAWTAKK